MQPGAPFACKSSSSSIARLTCVPDGVALHIPPFIAHHPYAATTIHDVAFYRDDVAAVFSAGATFIVRAQHPREATFSSIASMRRVLVTEAATFAGGEAALVDVTDRRVIVEQPIDAASSGSQLAVIDAHQLSLFDARGTLAGRRPLDGATAIAFEGLTKHWLVAAHDDLISVGGLEDEPVVIARGIGAAIRIRSVLDRLYYIVSPDGTLSEIENGKARTLAKFAPGWAAFDVGFELRVDEGEGPRPFFSATQCRCRTRLQPTSEWLPGKTPAGDGSYYYQLQRTCGACGETWIEEVYGA